MNLSNKGSPYPNGAFAAGCARLTRMIVGVGIDVVDVARFEEILGRSPGVRERVFTAGEQTRRPASLAALGAPAGLAWQDAEVVTAEDGRPGFEVRGSVAERCASLGVAHIHLSLSHDAGIASAVVVLEGSAAAAGPSIMEKMPLAEAREGQQPHDR